MTALHAHHRHNPELSHRKSSPWRKENGGLIRFDKVGDKTVTSRVEENPGNARCPFKYSVVVDGCEPDGGFADCVMYAKNRVSVLLARLEAASHV